METNEYVYDVSSKDKCWYKGICDRSRCGNTFCVRHYKMDCLTHMACMEDKLKYPVQLKLDANEVDKNAYLQLKEIQNNIGDFVSAGKNLLIYSENTGNGKTEWAKKLMLSWFNEIWANTEFTCRGLFISLPRFMTAMKENISKPNDFYQYVNENILEADVVVWDEINYKEYSTFEHDYLLSVISQRIATGKSNIYTTNFNLPIIEQRLGTRLASRIVGNSIKVEFKGGDKRSWGI